jgi:hypothetical protein
MAFASVAGAQVSGVTGSSIDVTRTPYLAIDTVPAAFGFPPIGARSSARVVFSDGEGPLSASRILRVTDARGSGGFTIQAQASGFMNGSDIIPASALRVVSTPSFDFSADSVVAGNVLYVNPFTGPKTIIAPLSADGTAFGQAGTFDAVQDRTTGNTMEKPVDILKGCLPLGEGRTGSVAVGLAFALEIPPYAVPGDYSSTITYTITDHTETPCP